MDFLLFPAVSLKIRFQRDYLVFKFYTFLSDIVERIIIFEKRSFHSSVHVDIFLQNDFVAALVEVLPASIAAPL